MEVTCPKTHQQVRRSLMFGGWRRPTFGASEPRGIFIGCRPWWGRAMARHPRQLSHFVGVLVHFSRCVRRVESSRFLGMTSCSSRVHLSVLPCVVHCLWTLCHYVSIVRLFMRLQVKNTFVTRSTEVVRVLVSVSTTYFGARKWQPVTTYRVMATSGWATTCKNPPDRRSSGERTVWWHSKTPIYWRVVAPPKGWLLEPPRGHVSIQ